MMNKEPVWQEKDFLDLAEEARTAIIEETGIDPSQMSEEEFNHIMVEDPETFSREELIDVCKALRAVNAHMTLDMAGLIAYVDELEALMDLTADDPDSFEDEPFVFPMLPKNDRETEELLKLFSTSPFDKDDDMIFDGSSSKPVSKSRPPQKKKKKKNRTNRKK